MTYFIFFSITILLLLSIIAFNSDLCAPAFLFTVGFWLSSFWLTFFNRQWYLTNGKLPLVLIGGITSFFLGCLIVQLFSQRKEKQIAYNTEKLYKVDISNSKILIFFCIEILFFLMSYYCIYRNTGSSNLITAMGLYYNASKYGRLVYNSSIIKLIQYFNFGMMYFVEYIILSRIILKQKNKISIYILFVGTLFISLMQGTRTTLFMGVISGLVMIFLLKGKANGWNSNINLKIICKLIVFVIFLGVLLNASLFFTGRSTGEYTIVQTISAYLGAPIKNLDSFLNDNLHNSSKVFGIATLAQTYEKIYKYTYNSAYEIPQLYTYRWIGNEGLGNVYTFFMPLYYDFGILGTWLMSFVLGGVCQKIYCKLKSSCKLNRYNTDIIIYSYIAFAVAFSFFSNKLFEIVVSVAFVYVMIGLESIIFIANSTIRKGKLVLKSSWRLNNRNRYE